jgi:predicted alpha/beta hydrolase family esterase
LTVILVTAKALGACDCVLKETKFMARAYDILRKLENGEFVTVASRNDLAQAKELAESLNRYWPAEYVVRDSASGDEIHLKQERLADRPQGVPKPGYTM